MSDTTSDATIDTAVDAWPPEQAPLPEQFVTDFMVCSRDRLTLLVNNADDSVQTVNRLNAAISGKDPRRVLLMAMGKSSQLFDRQRLGPAAWELAAAWLTGYQVTDVIVDRSHQLSPDLVNDLVRIARTAGASVWLIWSTTSPFHQLMQALTDEFPARVVSPGPDGLRAADRRVVAQPARGEPGQLGGLAAAADPPEVAVDAARGLPHVPGRLPPGDER